MITGALLLDLLQYGLPGFCLAVSLLGFYLLSMEQKKKTPKKLMLEAINRFTRVTLVIAFLVGGFSFAGTFFAKGDSGELVSLLPQEFQGAPVSKIALDINDLYEEAQETEKVLQEVDAIFAGHQQEIQNKENEIAKLKTELLALKDQNGQLQRGFLAKATHLSKEIPKFGSSINPKFPFNSEKQAVNIIIQELLADLGYYEGQIDGNGEATSKALINYQRSKGFETVGKIGINTLSRMIKDHFTNS